jgi:hypothetical protein
MKFPEDCKNKEGTFAWKIASEENRMPLWKDGSFLSQIRSYYPI